MSEIKLRALLSQTKINPQIDISGSIEDGMRAIFSQTLFQNHPELTFIRSPTPAVRQTKWIQSFLGESILDVVTKMENAFDIALCVLPTSDGGFILYLDKKAGMP